jgi:hypothetical protein
MKGRDYEAKTVTVHNGFVVFGQRLEHWVYILNYQKIFTICSKCNLKQRIHPLNKEGEGTEEELR